MHGYRQALGVMGEGYAFEAVVLAVEAAYKLPRAVAAAVVDAQYETVGRGYSFTRSATSSYAA